MNKIKKKKYKPRDLWVPDSWRYRGAGFEKNKKKVLPRNNKYKDKYDY